MIENIKKILEKEIEAIGNIPLDNKYEKAINIIKNKVHGAGGKLVISGMGKAGQIGLNISTTFSSTGTPSVYLHPSEAQHGDLGIIQQNDVLILLSNSGKTREILELTVMGDILVVETMKKIKFTKKEYSKRHHSGYLGKKSKEESKHPPGSLLNELPPSDYQLDN